MLVDIRVITYNIYVLMVSWCVPCFKSSLCRPKAAASAEHSEEVRRPPSQNRLGGWECCGNVVDIPRFSHVAYIGLGLLGAPNFNGQKNRESDVTGSVPNLRLLQDSLGIRCLQFWYSQTLKQSRFRSQRGLTQRLTVKPVGDPRMATLKEEIAHLGKYTKIWATICLPYDLRVTQTFGKFPENCSFFPRKRFTRFASEISCKHLNSMV